MDLEMLAELFKGTRFYWDYDWHSLAQLEEAEEANAAEYRRLKAEDPERLERIFDYICLLLSNALQPLAIKEYGNASDESMRQLLLQEMRNSEDMIKWRQMVDDALTNIKPDSPPRELVRQYTQELENQFAGVLAGLVGRVRMIPEADASAITSALFDMWKEAGHADSRRDTSN